MGADPIPAVVEADATGETARLFAELRDTLDVPFVNLIWRHLATIPGGLEWTWALLRPVYRSPALGAAADALVAAIEPSREALPSCVLEAAGMAASDRRVIRAMLTDYNRANALNFLGLSLAAKVLGGMAPPDPVAHFTPDQAPEAAPPRRPTVALPPLPALDTLPSSLRTLIGELDQFGRPAPSRAVGSLWRHLAHWPGFLALAHTSLLPFERDGSLRRRNDAVADAAEPVLADRLRPLLGRVPSDLPAGSAERVRAALDEFTRLMIGRMTVVGVSLLALLGSEP